MEERVTAVYHSVLQDGHGSILMTILRGEQHYFYRHKWFCQAVFHFQDKKFVPTK